jgi:hypothetical protein
MLANADRRQQLNRLIERLLGHGEEVLGRWARVMVSSRTYAEIVDRHVELYSRLSRPRLSHVSPATQAAGSVEDEWLRENLVAIAQLAESLDRGSFELALRIVPLDWWATRLPDRPSTAENLRTQTPTEVGVRTRPRNTRGNRRFGSAPTSAHSRGASRPSERGRRRSACGGSQPSAGVFFIDSCHPAGARRPADDDRLRDTRWSLRRTGITCLREHQCGSRPALGDAPAPRQKQDAGPAGIQGNPRGRRVALSRARLCPDASARVPVWSAPGPDELRACRPASASRSLPPGGATARRPARQTLGRRPLRERRVVRPRLALLARSRRRVLPRPVLSP